VNHQASCARSRLGSTPARKHSEKAKLEPITLQEACHTAAPWLVAAGVPPKGRPYGVRHVRERRRGSAQEGGERRSQSVGGKGPKPGEGAMLWAMEVR
jgi:hypothetical protein